MEKKTYLVYGVKVSTKDSRYQEFLEELKGDNEGDLFELHEDWTGVNSYLAGNDVVVGYANNVGNENEILKSLEQESCDYKDVILEFLGSDYKEKDFKFYEFQ
jgi:hypothetical protein